MTIDVDSTLLQAGPNYLGVSYQCISGNNHHGGEGMLIVADPAAVQGFTVGGTVSGLTGFGLVLQNGLREVIGVPANNSAFTFVTPLAANTSYDVRVLRQPTGQTCTVQNGSGTVTANVTGITVNCVSTGGSPVKTAISSSAHTCALKADQTVLCWGLGTSLELGNGTAISQSSPVAVTGLANVISLTAGGQHNCAQKSDGSVVCWGDNFFGQMGNAQQGSAQAVPAAVGGLPATVTEVSAGWWHNCALLADTSVVCWGQNNHGQLGDGSTTDSATPVPVSGLSGVAKIRAGFQRSCAIKTDGTVWCWGYNDSGTLGIGNAVDSLIPVQLPGVTNAVDMRPEDGSHGCVLKSDNTMMCWGVNSTGALGTGTFVDSNVPVPVPGVTALAMRTFAGSTCAIKLDTSVSCWGNNSNGQLGNGSSVTKSPIPVNVSNLSNAAQLSGGSLFACALKTDGTTVCWGANTDGQLGNGNKIDQKTPVSVLGGAIFWK